MNEALTPVRQRAGVVRSHIEEVTHHKIGMAGHEFIHGGDAGQKAAGEDVALNKIDAFAVVAIALILNGDGLNRHPPARTQTRLAGAEKCWQVALTDGLNHLNRHQLVVDPGQIAVVAEQHLNTILQPCPGDARGGPVVLLLRQRGGGHPAAVMTGGIFRHRPPAGANLQQMIVCRERQLVTQPRHFRLLSRGQILLVPAKQRAGVQEMFIKEMGVKGVAQIVMGGNIFPRLRAGVAPHPVPQPLHRFPEQAKPFFQLSEDLAIARNQLQQRRQVGRLPVAIHPRLCRGEAAPG